MFGLADNAALHMMSVMSVMSHPISICNSFHWSHRPHSKKKKPRASICNDPFLNPPRFLVIVQSKSNLTPKCIGCRARRSPTRAPNRTERPGSRRSRRRLQEQLPQAPARLRAQRPRQRRGAEPRARCRSKGRRDYSCEGKRWRGGWWLVFCDVVWWCVVVFTKLRKFEARSLNCGVCLEDFRYPL